MQDVGSRYARRHASRQQGKLYPVEFVVRMFLGSYPRLTMDRASYAGSAILDLGCGDGRNLAFLRDLGFTTYAVEITDELCALVRRRVADLGLDTVVKTGSNASIPFDDAFFDYVLCCHSLYYVQSGQTFADNLTELARVVKPGGTVVASLPKKYDRYTLWNAEPLGGNHFVVRHDPLKLRNGVIFRVFENEAEITAVFGEFFTDLTIGWMENDFFGIEERLWIAKMTRR